MKLLVKFASLKHKMFDTKLVFQNHGSILEEQFAERPRDPHRRGGLRLRNQRVRRRGRGHQHPTSARHSDHEEHRN